VSFDPEIRKLWLEISKTSIPLAMVRDEYIKLKGGEHRFMQLADVYSNLNTIETALFEYLDLKAPVFGRKPDREMLMVSRAAVENVKVLLDIAEEEVVRMRVQS
jgi:hypothetical protein